MKKLGILLGALCISICTFLLFYGDTAYQKWQDYNFQSDVKKIVEDGDKSELAKNSTVKSGWLGDKYVKVYSPNSKTEQATEIKTRLDEATKGLKEGDLDFDKDIKAIEFYGAVNKESNFTSVKEVSLKKVSHKIESKKISSAKETIVSSIYLDKDNNEFTLSSLFSSPDNAKQKFLVKIKQQLAIQGVSEEDINQIITKLRDEDMAIWKFTYNESKFNINVESNTSKINSVDIPINDLYKYIDETYLKGEDLEKYKAYIKKRSRKAVALTFDDGPNPNTTPVALELLKKYNAKATFFMVGRSVAGNEEIIKQVVAEGHQIGNHSWSHPLLTKISLEQAKS